MFYCEPCGHARGWPTDMFIPTSRGKCEMCGVAILCFDVPSKFLDVSTVVPDANNIDPWAEIIPGEAAAIESIKAAVAGKPNDKCSGCGTRPARTSAQHVPNDMDCREMQYERAWKNKEDGDDHHEDLDLLA